MRKLGFGILLLAFLFACGQEEAAEQGDDLTLNTAININDLPYVGPVSIKQTQMFSGNVMRSQISTSISIAGEAQELLSVFLINLDEGMVYFINYRDSNYVGLTFAELDEMLAVAESGEDTAAAELELARDAVNRKETEAKSIEPFGECVPVEFDLVLGGTGENAGYQSNMQGEMWLSNSIENAQLFMDFKRNALDRLKNSMAGNSAFFGIPAAVNLDPQWFERINQAISGIPVQAEFKITMPVKDETMTYGISMALEDYTTANISENLLVVPDGYRKVDFSQFRMY